MQWMDDTAYFARTISYTHMFMKPTKGWRGLPGSNVLAYLASSSMRTKKKFYKTVTCGQSYKTFTAVSYDFS
jgi:hypothetical protein